METYTQTQTASISQHKKAICKNFMHKKCDKGNTCKFIHNPDICFHFWKYNKCKFNDTCKKLHTSEPSQSNNKPPIKRKKNTECFEPMDKPVDMRIVCDAGTSYDRLSTHLTSRDVLLVPNLFNDCHSGELYHKLLQELEQCGIPQDKLLKMWHGNDKIDGTHLIVDDKTRWKDSCPTFQMVINRIRQFFNMNIQATRCNWYKDTSHWKPFHFDAAAVKEDKAELQNFTVAVSFGVSRDAAFEHADTKTVISIPQPDGWIYAFSKDTNIIWRHGILQDNPIQNKGRISIIAWGWIDNMQTL